MTDERLKELAGAACLCTDCEPDLLGEVRPMAEELLALRKRVAELEAEVQDPYEGRTPWPHPNEEASDE